jgi:hypothetical protein
VVNQLRDGRAVRGNHGFAASHGLQNREPESFSPRGLKDNGSLVDFDKQLLLRQAPQAFHVRYISNSKIGLSHSGSVSQDKIVSQPFHDRREKIKSLSARVISGKKDDNLIICWRGFHIHRSKPDGIDSVVNDLYLKVLLKKLVMSGAGVKAYGY